MKERTIGEKRWRMNLVGSLQVTLYIYLAYVRTYADDDEK